MKRFAWVTRPDKYSERALCRSMDVGMGAPRRKEYGVGGLGRLGVGHRLADVLVGFVLGKGDVLAGDVVV